MFPGSFDYYRASTIEESIALLEEHADVDAEILAGGHSLLPTMKSGLASPDVIIDIGGIEGLDGIEIGDETTRIGATAKYVDALDTSGLAERQPELYDALRVLGDRQVRNAGTIGGNLAHADPASDLPAVTVSADATMHVLGPDGERTVPAEDFFITMYTTDLSERDLLTAIEFPNLGPQDTAAYVKKSSPSSGYAMIGVAVRIETEDGAIAGARVAANGAFDHPRRLPGVEEYLAGTSLDEVSASDARAVATEGIDDWEYLEDIQVSGEFRAQLLEVFTARALEEALDRVAAPASA